MNVNGEHYQSIWFDEKQNSVNIIDQTCLPHKFETLRLESLDDACHAISFMQVRGAPLIGVAAAYGMYLALRDNPQQAAQASSQLQATRPTAVNLQWALRRVEQALAGVSVDRLASVALATAREMEREDIEICEQIGEHGAQLLHDLWLAKGEDSTVLNVLTHCNAGVLATIN